MQNTVYDRTLAGELSLYTPHMVSSHCSGCRVAPCPAQSWVPRHPLTANAVNLVLYEIWGGKTFHMNFTVILREG